MKQLEVQIMGQNYMLGCPQNSEARLLEAVETVDSAMCKIRDAGKVKARDRIAVLAALNLAYQLVEPPLAPVPPKDAQLAGGPPAEASDGADAVAQARLASLVDRLDMALASQNTVP